MAAASRELDVVVYGATGFVGKLTAQYLTGAAMFIRDSIDLHHKQAVDTGARIVHACGFDVIPADLSVYALYRRARGWCRPTGRHRSRAARLCRRFVRRHHRLDDGGAVAAAAVPRAHEPGSSMAAPVMPALLTAAGNAMYGLGGRFVRFLPGRLVERVAPTPGTGPSEERRQRGHYGAEAYTTTTTGALPGGHRPAGQSGLPGVVGAARRERTGAGAGPRQAVRPAWCAHPGSGDGRRAAGPATGGRCDVAGSPTELPRLQSRGPGVAWAA